MMKVEQRRRRRRCWRRLKYQSNGVLLRQTLIRRLMCDALALPTRRSAALGIGNCLRRHMSSVLSLALTHDPSNIRSPRPSFDSDSSNYEGGKLLIGGGNGGRFSCCPLRSSGSVSSRTDDSQWAVPPRDGLEDISLREVGGLLRYRSVFDMHYQNSSTMPKWLSIRVFRCHSALEVSNCMLAVCSQ